MQTADVLNNKEESIDYKTKLVRSWDPYATSIFGIYLIFIIQ